MPAVSMRFLLAAAAAAALWLPATGAADPVVLHSFVGERPANATYLLGPFTQELANRGYRTGSDLGKLVEERLSRSGRALSPAQVAEVRRSVDRGWEEWTAGNFDAAIGLLEPAQATLLDAPASLADDQTLRQPLRRALFGLALAHSRKGNRGESERYMAEVVRSFPDLGVDRGAFGPEAQRFYDRVKAALAQQSKGVLRIEVDASAGIFLNGRFLAIGRSREESLVPGRYRVFVRVGDGAGRVHEVNIAAGGTQTLNVLSGLDSVLRTRDYVGFTFASDEQRQREEANYATAVARAVGGGPIIVVGTYPGAQGNVLRGTLYTRDGSVLLKGDVAAEPVAPAPQVARNLARWLTGEDKADEVIVRVGEGAQPADAPAEESGGSRWTPIAKWTTGALGLAAAGTGTALLLLDGSCSSEAPATGECAEVYDTASTGLIVAGAGAALLTTSIVLFVLDRDRDEDSADRTATVAPIANGGWMMSFGGRF